MTVVGAASTRTRGRLLVLVGIVLVALTLRSAATAVSPLLDDLRVDLRIGTTAVGVLGLLAPACFAAVGACTPMLGRRFGLEFALVLSLGLTAAGSLTRPLAGDTLTFLALSAVTLSGMAMGNVLLPPLVKRYFPDRIGSITGLYVVLIAVGAALPPYVAVPVADAFGWRVSLGSWAVVAVIAVVPWLPRLRRTGGADLLDRAARLPVLRSRRAWGLTVMFGVTALNVYSLFAWLPTILVDAGLPVARAGALLGLYAGVGIPASIVVPVIASRMANPFPLVVLFAGFFLTGYAGLLAAPATATWLWLVFAGLGPSTFPISIAMINLRTTTESGSASLSGMVQGIGYGGAGLGPLAVGLLHDATGGWSASLVLLAGTVGLMLAGAWFACRPGTVEDEVGLTPAAYSCPR